MRSAPGSFVAVRVNLIVLVNSAPEPNFHGLSNNSSFIKMGETTLYFEIVSFTNAMFYH